MYSFWAILGLFLLTALRLMTSSNMNLILEEVSLRFTLDWNFLKYWSIKFRPVSWSILRPIVVSNWHMHSSACSSFEFCNSDSMHECMILSVRKFSLNNSPMNLQFPTDFLFHFSKPISHLSNFCFISSGLSWNIYLSKKILTPRGSGSI